LSELLHKIKAQLEGPFVSCCICEFTGVIFMYFVLGSALQIKTEF